MRLEYEIAAVGLDQLKRVLRGAEQEIVASSRRMTAATARASGRSSIGRASSPDATAREARRAAQQAERDAAKAAAQGARATEMAARKRAQAETRAAAVAQRLRDRDSRAAERAEREKSRAVERETARREAIRQRSFSMEQRLRDRDVRAEQRAAERQIAASRRARESMARGVTRSIGSSTRKVAGLAGGVLALGGGFLAGEAISSSIGLESQAGTIVRGAENTGGLTKADVMDRASKAAMATGGDTGDMLAGLDEFTRKTGDLEKGVQLMGELSKLAAATGTAFQDMGSTAAEVFNTVGNEKDTLTVMKMLAAQGKAGAIDIRDLAQYGARLTSSASLFEGSKVGNIESFGALTQIAKKYGGATDAAEGTEAVASFFGEAATHQKDFAALGKGASRGVKLMGAGGKLRNVEDIIAETIAKTGGNTLELEQLFGRRGSKPIIGLTQEFNARGGQKLGEKDQIALVKKILGEFKATLSDKEVNGAVADKMTETSAKMNRASEEFRRAVATDLLPVVTEIVPELAKLVPTVAKAAEAFAKIAKVAIEHPILGIGAAIVASVTKDVVATKVGERIAQVLEGVVKPPAPGTPGAPPGGPGSKVLPLAAAGAAGYAAGTLLANDIIDPALSGKDRGVRRAGILTDNAETITRALNSGKINAGQAAHMLGDIQRDVGSAKINSTGGDLANAIFGTGSLAKFSENNTVATDKGLQEAIAKLSAAIEAKRGAEPGTSPADAAAALTKAASALQESAKAIRAASVDPARGGAPIIRR